MPLGGAWLTPRGGFKPRRGAARGAILSGQGRSALRGCAVAMAAAGTSGLYVNPNTGAAQAGLMPFRNAIINGDMRINQRGTSTNLASLTTLGATHGYVVDRWNVFRGGIVSGALIGQGTNLTIADAPFLDAGIKTFSRIGRTGTDVSDIVMDYNLESQDSTRFLGKTVTLSFYYRTGADYSGSALNVQILTGTGTDQSMRVGFTNTTLLMNNNLPTTSSWIRKTIQAKISSSINQIALRFIRTPSGTAGAADYFDITGVQLELGSVATPFEVRPYPVELQLCQRYYYKISNTHIGYIISSSFLYGGRIDYKTVMRTGITNFEGGVFVVSGGNAGTVGLAGQTTEWVIPYNSTNNWTPGNACYLQNAGVNAEL